MTEILYCMSLQVYQVIPQHQKYHVIMPTLQRKLQAKVTQTVQSQNRNYLNMLQTIINRSVIMEKNDSSGRIQKYLKYDWDIYKHVKCLLNIVVKWEEKCTGIGKYINLHASFTSIIILVQLYIKKSCT